MTEQPVFSSFLLHRPEADGDSLKTLVDGDLMKESEIRHLQPYLDKSVARCTLARKTMCASGTPLHTHTAVAHATRRGPPDQQLWQALWGCPPPQTQRTTVVDLGDP